jgi:prevent-host-death family protein
MSDVSIRDLENHGGEVFDRAQRGERMTITRAGKPVARLTALGPAPLTPGELLRRRKGLPAVDPVQLRADVDSVIDAAI